MRSPVAKAYGLANEMVYIFEAWIKADAERTAIENNTKIPHIRLSFKKEQQLKLIKLKLLSLRYKLEIPEILDIVMPTIRNRMLKHNKKAYGLGLNINVLCGKAIELCLQQDIRQIYPDGDHIVQWQAARQDEQLTAEERLSDDGFNQRIYNTALDAPSIEKFVESYSRRVLSKRAQDSDARHEETRRRKLYRGNPWL